MELQKNYNSSALQKKSTSPKKPTPISVKVLDQEIKIHTDLSRQSLNEVIGEVEKISSEVQRKNPSATPSKVFLLTSLILAEKKFLLDVDYENFKCEVHDKTSEAMGFLAHATKI